MRYSVSNKQKPSTIPSRDAIAWHEERKGKGRGGPVTEWVVAEVCSGMGGCVIEDYVG